MLLKFLIVFLLIALLISLGSGFYFLMIDQGDKQKRRLFHSLGMRLAFVAMLMMLIVYGVSTGQLRSQAPWDAQPPKPAAAAQSQPPGTSQ